MKNVKKRRGIFPRTVLAAALVLGAAASVSISVLAADSSSSAVCDAMAGGGACTMDMSGDTSSLPACCQSQTSGTASGTASASQTQSTVVCSMPGMAANTASAGSTASAASGKDSCDFGTVDILTVSNEACGIAEFQKIAGQKEHTATFEKADASGNVLYSWTFKGTDVKTPANVDMNVDVSTEGALADAVAQVVSGYGETVKNGMYLHLGQSGVLPGKASLSVAANGQFTAKDAVSVYYYNEEKNRVEPVALDIKPVNGYVSFTISHASDYFLTAQKLHIPFWSRIESWMVVLAAAILGAAAGVLVLFWLFRRKARAARR